MLELVWRVAAYGTMESNSGAQKTTTRFVRRVGFENLSHPLTMLRTHTYARVNGPKFCEDKQIHLRSLHFVFDQLSSAVTVLNHTPNMVSPSTEVIDYLTGLCAVCNELGCFKCTGVERGG